VLGLPDRLHARSVDFDGVLQALSEVTDYHKQVNGKPRVNGTGSFLVSCGHRATGGALDDPPPHAETVHSLGTC